MPDYLNLLLDIDTERGVAILTFNRADKLNVLNRASLQELDAALEEISANSSVRALIITGAGTKAFVAGADIAEMAALDSYDAARDFALFGQSVFTKVERLTIPVIMAINGYALGGGCELALCGDIRLASETAQLGQPEVNLGIIPGYGGSQRLARTIGRDRAKGLVFTGERVGAEDALRLGLVDRIVPAATLMDEALSLALTLAGKAPRALALAKMAINDGVNLPLEEALDLEAELFAQSADTADRREGTTAFLEKRQPKWSGN